jgi:hypothetical protein
MKGISTLLIYTVLLSVSGLAWAQTEEEKCARYTTEFFQREFKSSKSSLSGVFANFAQERCMAGDMCDFQYFYNGQQKKCFILITVDGNIPPIEAKPLYRMFLLYGAYERINYGTFWSKRYRNGEEEVINCWLKGKFGVTPLSKPPACKSGYEFLDALKLYLEK